MKAYFLLLVTIVFVSVSAVWAPAVRAESVTITNKNNRYFEPISINATAGKSYYCYTDKNYAFKKIGSAKTDSLSVGTKVQVISDTDKYRIKISKQIKKLRKRIKSLDGAKKAAKKRQLKSKRRIRKAVDRALAANCHCNGFVADGKIIDGPSGPDGPDYDSIFRSLAIHPNDPNTILIGTERNGFVKSVDGGQSWSRHRVGLTTSSVGTYPEIWDIQFSPSNPEIIVAATLDSPGPVGGNFPSSNGGVYKSIDGGETWMQMTCGFPTSRVNSVRFDNNDPNIILAGLEGDEASFSSLQGEFFPGGVYRSTDGGQSWNQVSLANGDAQNGYWNIRSIGSDSTTYFTFGMEFSNLSNNVGFFMSEDGVNWTSFGDSSITGLLIPYFDISPDGNTIYAHERDSNQILRSTDAGQSWETISEGTVNGPVRMNPENSSIVIYGSSKNIYRTIDGFQSVTKVFDGLRQIHDIEFAPSDSNIVYVATEGYLIYRSEDAGATFQLVADIRNDVLNAD